MKAPWIAVGILLFSGAIPLYATPFSTKPPQAYAEQYPIEKINLNSADVLLLTHAVKGIGKKRAEAIVDYRTSHGKFRALGDLAMVKGLGAGFVQKHRTELEQVFVLE